MTKGKEAKSKEVKPKKIHFSWMGAFWSCSEEEWGRLQDLVENEQPVDMDNCRQLGGRPKGRIYLFRDNIRREEI